jgi:hypothetical protein
MPTMTQKFEKGPLTFNVGPNSVIGGRLVMPDTGNPGTIIHTTLNTTKCLGVALMDAMPLSGQTVDGFAVTSAIVRPDVAVATEGVYRLWASAAINFGDRVVADASGYIKAYTAGTSTFDQIVGKCVEPGGIAAPISGVNQRGKILLDIV